MQYGETIETPNNIRSLILEKEKELHDINEYRIRTLEGLLKEKEQAANGFKQKFYKLQEDFKYNLKLLEGRDEELAMYDSNFATLKIVVRDRESEISELKIQLADAQSDLKAEKLKASEGDMYMQQKLKEVRGAMESTRWSYDEDMRKAKEEVESLKRRHDRELREKEEDIDAVRRDLTVTFDEVLRQREQEFRFAHDDISGKARDLELKVKSMARETETLKDRNNELRRKVDELVEQLNEGEKAHKALQWELADVRAMKEAKITELEQETVELQQVKQALLDEYEGKMADLLQSLHAVEKAFLAQKAKFDDDLKRVGHTKDEELKAQTAKMEARIESVVGKLRVADETLEKVQADFKQAKWEAEDQLLQREREMERMASDHQDALDQRESMLKDLKNELWGVEVELKSSKDSARSSIQLIQDAKEKEAALRREVQLCNETIEELKRQLHSNTLSLESKLEEAEHEWIARHEFRMREVLSVRDRLTAEKQAAEERLKHTEAELMRIRGELHAEKVVARVNEAFPIPSVPSEVSPVWSDAGGGGSTSMPSVPPPASLSSIQQTPPPSVDQRQDLMVENTRLKGMIRTMTEELMKQTVAPSPVSPTTGNELEVQLTQAQEKYRQLEMELQLQLREVQAELASAKKELDARNSQIAQLQTQLQQAQAQAPTETTELRKQLTDAVTQLDLLKKERDSLMELSNQLTSENRKLQRGSLAVGDTTSMAFQQQEIRIVELTKALEEYRVHNKALKKELRRWLKRDDSASSSIASSVAVAFDHEGNRSADDVKPLSLDAARLEVESARKRTPSFTDSTKDVPVAPTLSDARLKLKHAKEVLALAGKKVDMAEPAGGRPRAPSLVNKETESQRTVMSKLKELQSKRAEMAEERKKVRNYSISSATGS
ncbi:Aste57867_15064 [Aphanomyces stellatus]|uniref:Aste57867_15064 protein n=1 Tax=Aphanomyces stellatus TaxID=120398 RepID=A0A485L429_9STRA|nr:hypothetical protein As57867_015008 [Aphanomyces stellatus]VFT91878.1 Aste57867_15064 [Aphanomyces stellatus]